MVGVFDAKIDEKKKILISTGALVVFGRFMMGALLTTN